MTGEKVEVPLALLQAAKELIERARHPEAAWMDVTNVHQSIQKIMLDAEQAKLVTMDKKGAAK